MRNDIAIKVEHLSKRYRMGQYVGSGAQYKTLRESLTNAVSAPFRRLRSNSQSTIHDSKSDTPQSNRFIWALRDVSFKVKQGEVLGIIGRNGAGKSTLLKVLTHITEPTQGRAELKGRVGSLLEVGTGFHPELTGRENIYLSGAILGMARKEIDRKFDEIVDFSGVETYIDTPVKRYSSGMRVRLGFAVAAHLEPEILLIDEVLAVGDAEFQKKCLGKMGDVAREGRTVLFVSHNMAAIRNLSRRTLLIEQGRIAFDGDTQAAVSQYLDRNLITGAMISGEELEKRGEVYLPQGELFFRCREIALLDQDGQPRNEFNSDEEITVSVIYECFHDVPDLWVVIHVTDDDGSIILRSENKDDPSSVQTYALSPGLYRSRCVLPRDLFGERRFYISVHLAYLHVEHVNIRKILSFVVRFQGYNNNYSIDSKQGYIRPRLRWQTANITAGEEIDYAG